MRLARPALVGLVTLALGGPALAAAGTSAEAASADQPVTAPVTGPVTVPARPQPPRDPVEVGRGGAVSSVDPDATRIGLQVLRDGGDAVDAAIATAAALGVTEPFSAGLGGGGYFVLYNQSTGEAEVLDGRETAPAAMPRNAFIDPDTHDPYPFFPDLVTSGVSVGVPGTPRLWEQALDLFGSYSLREALAPAARLAERGFVVDRTFRLQTQENAERFAAIRPTKRLFLPGGEAPAVGSVFRNPQLARTYRMLGKQGMRMFYRGPIAEQITRLAQDPPTTRGTDLPVPPGFMEESDLAGYRVIRRNATEMHYRGLRVRGVPPSSSGATTVGEALNIMENLPAGRPVQRLHNYLEASALSFADRAEFVGDPAYTDVPVRQLLSEGFGRERACAVDPDEASETPVAAGEPDGDYTDCPDAVPAPAPVDDHEGLSTTHLTVADRWGSVVSYTLTIEQTGGSGITVPKRGFLLNNELTDFGIEYDKDDPNRIQPGKRPRSSMSPTIVFRGSDPWLALGSPGGSTIITTVLQVLMNRIDLGMTLPEAVAAPRANQGNTADVVAERAFIDLYGRALRRYGHSFVPPGDPGTSASEIGAVAAIELRPDGSMLAAAEPTRRGGGDAGVVRPERP